LYVTSIDIINRGGNKSLGVFGMLGGESIVGFIKCLFRNVPKAKDAHNRKKTLSLLSRNRWMGP
jgi:hypothetical protein